MDKETIQQIAAEVVARLPDIGYGWWPLAIQTVLMLLVAGSAAYFGSYFRTRGQNLATKHDFTELRKQLSANTRLVESIKSEVSLRDWAQREHKTLRRTKLETLLDKTHECWAYLQRAHLSAIAGEPAPSERDHISELNTLANLFPELDREANDFALICREQMILSGELGLAVHASRDDPLARQAAYDDFKAKSLFRKVAEAQSSLTAAANSLLERIMNVDERTSPSDER